MTQYLCVDASHRRDGKRVPVDVTDSVRLERSLIPRPSVYVATTEDVVQHAISVTGSPADRRVAIERRIAGEYEPVDLPVVLVSARSSSRPPGRYEWDDLRRDGGLLDQLAAGPVNVSPEEHDVILLEDERPDTGGGAGVATKTRPRLRVIPQGVFDIHELAARIAIARRDEESILDAIRNAPRATVGEVVAEGPWRVIVPCPVIEAGEPRHDVLFTGVTGREPAVLYGTFASGIDENVEATAEADLFPSAELARVERAATLLIAAEIVIVAGALLAGWASGALALVAREHGGWLGLALVLALAAVGFAVLPQFVTRDPRANLNDVFNARRSYANRTALLGWTSAISAVLFCLALLVGISPVLAADRVPRSETSVAFQTATTPVLATIQVDVQEATGDDSIVVEVVSFSTTDADGTVVARFTDLAEADGTGRAVRTIAMRPGDDLLAVAVGIGDDPAPPCTPSSGQGPGCTIVAIPPAAAGTSGRTPTASSTSSSAANVSVVTPGTPGPSPTPTLTLVP